MDVSACTIELNNVGNHVNEVAVNLSGYKATLSNAIEIQASYLTLEETLKIANKQCSKIDGALSHSDASNVLDAANKLSPSIDLLSATLDNQKTVVNSDPVVAKIVRDDIKQAKELTNSLMDTLFAIFPEETKESASVHLKNINSHIEKAEQNFNTL
ncbi:hypothetical protein BY458DRAFT_508186 [Sporodiniella umbellata]|nr:hypothetical protein BY458DRAFT_508186 [Sporodiniella umbellata]